MFKQLDKPVTSQHSERANWSSGTYHGKAHAKFKKAVESVGGMHSAKTGTFELPNHAIQRFHNQANHYGFKHKEHYSLGETSQHSEEDDHEKVISQYGYKKGANRHSHPKLNAHISVSGNGSWKHYSTNAGTHYVNKTGKSSKDLHEYLKDFHKSGGPSTQHSEEAQPTPLATPVSFVPTSFGSVAPAIQFRETEAEQFGEEARKPIHETMKGHGYASYGPGSYSNGQHSFSIKTGDLDRPWTHRHKGEIVKQGKGHDKLEKYVSKLHKKE